MCFGYAFAGMEDRFSDINLKRKPNNYIDIPEISAPSGNPTSNWGWIYVKDNSGTSDLYFEDDGGTVTELTAAGNTSWDNIANAAGDNTISFADNYTTKLTFADTNEDMLTIEATGAFGDVSVMRVESGAAATDGTVLEVVAEDANVDPLVVSSSGKANALVVGQNTGVVTIAGVAEGTDALILTAGDLKLSDGDIDLSGGDALFGEDLDVTNNVTIGGTLEVTGATTLTGTFYTSALAPSAGNITLNANGSGTISIGNSSTGAIGITGGGVDIGDGATDTLTITGIIDSDVSLDDGTTDSPKLIFIDSDNEQHELYADQDTDDLNLELANADDCLSVTVGNISIDSTAPSSDVITINGDDLFVGDDVEIDGRLVVDTTGEGLDVNESVDIDFDATDEIFRINTSAEVSGGGVAVAMIESDDADLSVETYLLELRHTDNGDAQGDFLCLSDNDGGTELVVFNAGGETVWTLDPAAFLQIAASASTASDGIIDINHATAADATEAIHINSILTTGNSETYHGLYINLDDDTADTGTARAIGIGASDSTPAGGSTTMDGIAILTGIDRGITMDLDAASTAMVVDAATAINTSTTGIFNISMIASEPNAEAIFIDFESEANGATEELSAVTIQIDDDADNADNEVIGMLIQSDGDDGAGLQIGINVKGANMDRAAQFETGYVHIGTGSTPGSANASDDLFVEDAIEVDGDADFDGNIIGDGGSKIEGFIRDTEVVAAANNDVAITESGVVYFLNAAGGFQTTLPAVAAGLHYKFIVKTAPAGGSYTVISNGTANIIYGIVVVNGASVQGAAEDTITFANGAAAIGDWAEVECDGTNWYVTGIGNAAGAITLTQAD
jgi:hypothetical protein